MNLRRVSGIFRLLTFRAARAAAARLPGGRISAFGPSPDRIESILVLNLDRQPARWRRLLRELGRLRTFDGTPLTSIATRLASVDARDGRAVAATADVDPNYRLGDQFHVQPDARLEACFSADEPVRMTRQEVAVARSHIEAWKVIATGEHEYVLVLEDDVWFTSRAAEAIEWGWRAALERRRAEGGPSFLYLSYEDAGESAERAEPCYALFRPIRGLWFLSGYVLSRDGAAALLRAMPVTGPVDMWMNYRFHELGALALSSPAIHQRRDCTSDNCYSVLPYLARAGIVDAGSGPMPPERSRAGPVIAWTAGGDREGLAMALSMLGLRVRVFDGDEKGLSADELADLTLQFDTLIDAPLMSDALAAAVGTPNMKFFQETGAVHRNGLDPSSLPASRTAFLSDRGPQEGEWDRLCTLLDLPLPPEPFPVGALRSVRMFRDDRGGHVRTHGEPGRLKRTQLDHSPWVLPPISEWQPHRSAECSVHSTGGLLVSASLTVPTSSFAGLVETFPGNQASFSNEGLILGKEGFELQIDNANKGEKPYLSGAFTSVRSFGYGRFEADIKVARGSGLVTGFFLHRSAPRQEIDFEFPGNDLRVMIVNVYFNPGDEGTAMAYGYRGAPCLIDLGFDAGEEFHRYAIDWRPDRIAWLVDGKILHERVSWDPTPIPHLPMSLHANLWAPRSEDLAGRVNAQSLPTRAVFKNVAIWE